MALTPVARLPAAQWNSSLGVGKRPGDAEQPGAQQTATSRPLRLATPHVSTPARVPSLTPTDVAVDRHVPHSVLRDASGRISFDIPPRQIRDALADPSTKLWIDIDSTSRHQHAILGRSRRNFTR